MKLISLGAIALMIQPIFSFCISNGMEGDAQFYIAQIVDLEDPSKAFQATLGPGAEKCCDHSNTDCSPFGKDDDSAMFGAQFSSGKQMLASCDTGGTISFHGNSDNPTAICTGINGGTIEYDFKGMKSSGNENQIRKDPNLNFMFHV